MKKLILMTALISVCTGTMANQPLNIQHGAPEPLGEPVQYKETSRYNPQSNFSKDSYASFNLGYAGAKLGFDDLGGDSRFNGVDIGLSAVQDNLMIGFGYSYLDESDLDYSEIYSKFGYRLFNQNNNYGVASIGVGYAWIDAKDLPLKLEYFTIPVEFELGHYIQPNLAVYAALGYKWLSNTEAEACLGDVCASGSSSELDVDGVTYKAGLRLNF